MVLIRGSVAASSELLIKRIAAETGRLIASGANIVNLSQVFPCGALISISFLAFFCDDSFAPSVCLSGSAMPAYLPSRATADGRSHQHQVAAL
jgi:hypothetical protein